MASDDSRLEEAFPEYELRVSDEQGETVVTARLDLPADEAFRLFCDPDHLSEWLFVVGTVVVGRRDACGRPLEIDFMGSLDRCSISYALGYVYDDAAREVRWSQTRGSPKRLCGSARFIPRDDESCMLRYVLTAELPSHLPPWSDELYRSRPAETVVLDFCEWLRARAGW
jgi:hypothetical protein